MKKGLFSKMVMTFTIIIAVSFVITAAILSIWFESYYFDQRKSQLLSESQFIRPEAIEYLKGNVSQEGICDKITYIAQYSSVDIWLVDTYGYVYAVSGENNKKLVGTQFLINELDNLRAGHEIEKRILFNGYNLPVHSFIMPMFNKGSFIGAIVMNTSIEQLRGPLKKVYEIIWISAIFAIIASCFVIYYFSQRIIIKPLKQINYAADKLSKGQVDKRAVVYSNDEIGEVAKAFNSMADSLEEVEKNRREFISNVSHEIRSPITSIKGFIGGILDGVIPKEKENYYLSVTYEEIQRLTRLVNDLLDLSAIEAGQFRLRIEELDINEIIRLCAIKFESKIKSKKLNVDVCFQDDNLYVAADKDRITQVVTNLFDNAIKYVTDGGNITISTKVKGTKAYISVFNDNANIPEDDLKHIWDRFYKGDKSRSAKTSTGLGLSIVRSIITQHGEDIWVENKGNGVEFTFTLKRL